MATVTIRRTITRLDGGKYELQDDLRNNFNVRYFDARLYHTLAISSYKALKYDAQGSGDSIRVDTSIDSVKTGDEDYHFAKGGRGLYIYPYHTYANFSGDYYESEDSIVERMAEINAQLEQQSDKEGMEDVSTLALDNTTKELRLMLANLVERYHLVRDFNLHFQDSMIAPHSLIHPYAIVKFAGAHGSKYTAEGLYTFDNFATRKWYEVDGDNLSSYASTPTTTKLIAWGSEDIQGRTPYSYQDFVFCKYWNIIPNNRMITLRRYFAPVTDNIEFDNYKQIDSSLDIPYEDSSLLGGKALYTKEPNQKVKNMGFSPLATAVTYFGENTGNELSNFLNFSVKYNWKALEAQNSPITVDAEANEHGAGLTNPDFGINNGDFIIPKDIDGNGNDYMSVEFHYYTPYDYCGNCKYYFWGDAYKQYGEVPEQNEKSISDFFDRVVNEWSNKGLGIVIGEWGVTDHTKGGQADLQHENVTYYSRFFVSEARKRGFSTFVWDNNQFGNGTEKFGIFDRERGMKVKYESVLKGIMEGKSPL